MPIVIVTGLLDYLAYGPQFGQAMPADTGWLRLPQFDWPTRPSWIFRLSQGLHVGLGLVLIPVVLAKLWSVVPRLFAWPPVRSTAQGLERLSLLALVGGLLFEIVTGVLPPAPATVADLGCGTGTLSLLLAEQGYAVDGEDAHGIPPGWATGAVGNRTGVREPR
jgi:SAM-dependent methyltransferase